MTTEDWDEVPVHKCKSKVKNNTNNNNNNNNNYYYYYYYYKVWKEYSKELIPTKRKLFPGPFCPTLISEIR